MDREKCNTTNIHPINKPPHRLPPTPNPRRRNLTGIKPRNRQPPNPQKDLEDKHKRRGRVRRAARPDAQQDGYHAEAETQARGAEHEQRAPPVFLDREERDEGCEEVGEGCAAAEDEREFAREVHGVGVDDGRVVVYLAGVG